MAEDSFFGHTEESQKAALEKIKNYLPVKDADAIYENVMYLEKLKYMTLEMKRELLKKFTCEQLALSFKFSSQTLMKEFLKDLSGTIKQEILHHIQRKISLGEFQKRLLEVSKYVREQAGKGHFVLDKDSNDTYV